MRLNSLTVRDGLAKGEYHFDSLNVIYSVHNAQGKTTLLRCLLYALGYQVPATKGLRFERMEFDLSVRTENGGNLMLKRRGNVIDVVRENESISYSLPVQVNDLHRQIFDISNPLVLDNLLGAYYLDQEKGWTLLNRGKVIGGIRFSLEDLLSGLSEKSFVDHQRSLASVDRELRRYRQMRQLAQYKVEIQESGTLDAAMMPTEKMTVEIMRLMNEKRSWENELARLKVAIRRNEDFKKYIAAMCLKVRCPNGEVVPVTEETILDFKNIDNLVAYKAKNARVKISELDNKIAKIEDVLENNNTLFGPMQTSADEFNVQVSRIRIDSAAVERMIGTLEKRKKSLQAVINTSLSSSAAAVAIMQNIVWAYLDELGVDKKYGDIFTHDLKSSSGTLFYIQVFAFKAAYIRTIRERTGCVLPFILDSPHGREVEETVVRKVYRIVCRDFSGHQVLLATIYNPELTGQHLITMDGYVAHL